MEDGRGVVDAAAVEDGVGHEDVDLEISALERKKKNLDFVKGGVLKLRNIIQN